VESNTKPSAGAGASAGSPGDGSHDWLGIHVPLTGQAGDAFLANAAMLTRRHKLRTPVSTVLTRGEQEDMLALM